MTDANWAARDQATGSGNAYLGLDGAPVSSANPVPVADTLAGTREYAFAQATRTAVGSGSTSAAIGTLNARREVMLTASTDCYVKFGTSGVTVSASDADCLRMFSGERFHLRLGSAVTHYAVIQDSAAGYLRCTPAA